MAESRDQEKAATPQPKVGTSSATEIDPELVRLPRARTKIRPIMALAIIGICLTMGWRLLPDLLFSRMSPTPVVVSGVDMLKADLENHFVEIAVRPDRTQAVRVLPTGSSVGEVLMPAFGTGGKLWLLLPPSPWAEPHQTSERYRGRLMRIDAMDFSDALRSYFKQGNNVPRPIALSEVRKALASHATSLHDIAGDTLRVEASSYVRVHEVAAERAWVHAVSTDPYDNEAAWRLALEGAGILPHESVAVSSDTGSWTFEVPAPDGVEGVRRKLVEARLFAASADEIANTREGTWSELALDGEDILLGKPQLGFRAEQVSVGATIDLPADAFLLNTTETPETYWYVPVLALVLAGFILLFAFGLYRSSRP